MRAPTILRLTVLGAVAALAFGSAGVASAYFTSSDSSNPAAAAAAALPPPTGGVQTGTTAPTSISIEWTAPAPASGPAPAGYVVLRCAGSCTPTTAITSGGCKGTISGTSCTDDRGLAADSTYTYAVESRLDGWVSTPDTFQALTGSGAQLGFTTQPASGADIPATGAGHTFAVAVAVQLSDGATVTNDDSDAITISLGEDPASGVLSCTTGLTVMVDRGVARFTGCAIPQAGDGYALTATSVTSPALTAPANANSFDIVPGPASKLVFTTPAVTGATAGSAGLGSADLGPVTLQEVDSAGNPVPAGAAGVTVSLSATPAAGAAFADSQFGPPVSGVTIAAGQSSASFYFGDSDAGLPRITAQASGLPKVTQTETITAFSPADLGSGPATCDDSGTCTGPSVSSVSGLSELVFVYVSGSGSGSTSVTGVGGPFDGTPASYASVQQFPAASGGSDDNYVFAYEATGNGSSAAVSASFADLGPGASVWIDVVQLGSGDAPVACDGCTDSGTGSPATVLTGVNSSTDSEIAFVGTADSTSFDTAPAGFSELGGGSSPQHATFASPLVAGSYQFGLASSGAGWGSIGVEVSP